LQEKSGMMAKNAVTMKIAGRSSYTIGLIIAQKGRFRKNRQRKLFSLPRNFTFWY
jgi:hypothetical protein